MNIIYNHTNRQNWLHDSVVSTSGQQANMNNNKIIVTKPIIATNQICKL